MGQGRAIRERGAAVEPQVFFELRGNVGKLPGPHCPRNRKICCHYACVAPGLSRVVDTGNDGLGAARKLLGSCNWRKENHCGANKPVRWDGESAYSFRPRALAVFLNQK